ncbi:MAG TPA: hypothetical protein VKB80_03160 [Kofleriaceae bacterium]|nr:hypothetical protein [Kofleriaceae bacterium]
MLFTLHTDDDRVQATVAAWPSATPLAATFLETPTDDWGIDVQGLLQITVANGWARYRVVDWDAADQTLRLELIEGHLDG